MNFFRDILNPFRVIKILLFFLIVVFIAFVWYIFSGVLPKESTVTFGVTFSQPFAEQMGIDWREAYSAILDDLGVRKLRLIAYWPEIESQDNQFYFDDLDWQVREARKRGAEIILAVGCRLPRWPECYVPDWVKSLPEAKQEEKVLRMLSMVVEHYKDENAIKVWQVENEPFLKSFGECPKLDEGFLDEEIALVRRLDLVRRPVMLTTSGELSDWTKPALKADILGTSLYRMIWSDFLGHFRYPIPPGFYYKREKLTKWLTGIDKIVLIELQAEPWGPKMIYETSIKEQGKSMDLDMFKEVIEYTKRTGFDEAYLWGVEWWYQRKVQRNDAFWGEAKKLFR